MTDLSNIEILLFDLGGVIIDIDFDRALQSWATASGTPFESIKNASLLMRIISDMSVEKSVVKNSLIACN